MGANARGVGGPGSRAPVRILLGYSDVAAYLSGLKSALEGAGATATLVDLTSDRLDFRRPSGAARAKGARLLQHGVTRAIRRVSGRLPVAIRTATKTLARLLILPIAILRYDAVILSGIDVLPGGLDLRILKAFRRRVIVVFTGSDHRPPYLNSKWVRELDQRGSAWMAAETRRLCRRVEAAERFADVIVAHPASAQFHRRQFIAVLRAGLPISLESQGPGVDGRRDAAGPVRLLHCPTDPIGKGTDQIRSAVDAVRARGLAVDLTEISGRPHSEVIAALAGCDLLVDEVFSDTPMGVLAAEAAFLGKPTLVSGYLAADEASLATLGANPPTHFVAPDQLAAALETLVRDAKGRLDLGQTARSYVSEGWALPAIAARYLRLVSGDIPADWWSRPADVTYASGWGLPHEELARALRILIGEMGPDATQLPPASPVRRQLLDMAR